MEEQKAAGSAATVKPKKQKGRFALIGYGIWFIALGILAMVLPTMGYTLLLFRFIPVTDPVFAVVLMVIGVAMIVFHFVRKAKAKAPESPTAPTS